MQRFTMSLVICLSLGLVMTSSVFAVDAEAPLVEGDLEEGVVEGSCSAVVDCWDGSTRSCTGTTPCTYVDSSCPGTRGYVSCGGSRTYCPACPLLPCTTEGDRCWGNNDCNPSGQDCDCICDYSARETSRIPIEGGLCRCLMMK